MTKSKPPFDQVLSECVQAVLVDDATITSCMERYPEHADKLAQLLPQVRSLRRSTRAGAPGDVRPGLRGPRRPNMPARSPTFGPWERVRTLFTTSRARRADRRSALTWALIGSMLVAILGFGGVSAAYAADGASPGQPLYHVDKAVEAVRMTLAVDAVSRAELALAFAHERVAEAETLAGQAESTAAIAQAAAGYEANVQQAASALAEAAALGENERADALQSLLVLSLSVHEARLSEVAGRVPENAAAAIQAAIQASQATRQPVEARRPSIEGDRSPEGVGPPEGESRPEDPGPPDGTGQPEDIGPSGDTGRPEGVGTPEAAGPPESGPGQGK